MAYRSVIPTNFPTGKYLRTHVFKDGELVLRMFADGKNAVVIEQTGQEDGLSNSLDWIAETMAKIRFECEKTL